MKHMRKLCILLFSFVTVISAVQAQHSKVSLLGRWGKGPSEAVFRRAGYTFIGNGGYLEVYRNQSGSYNKLDDILLPGPVNTYMWHVVILALVLSISIIAQA
jgi:hypothetical protein